MPDSKKDTKKTKQEKESRLQKGESRQKEKPKPEVREEKEAKTLGRNRYLVPALIAIAIIIIGAAAYLYVLPELNTQVPFSTFKATFQSAQRISIVATYMNSSQYADEVPCFTSVIQIVAYTRKPSTIDFYAIDAANNTCTYSTSGLGGSISPTTTNSSYCISKADSEPAIFLNYSATNSTSITAKSATVFGNQAYMLACPISIELS